MIARAAQLARLEGLLRRHRVVALLGPRQVGKTTLARELAARRRGPVTFLDLEDPRHLARLAEPMLALGGLRGLVIIDEVQRRPELFPVLRVLADRPRPAKFLLLGSASPELLRQSSESLAGRIAYDELQGLSLGEVGAPKLDRLWLRGGFPRSFVAPSAAASFEWRTEFLRTFLERDVPQLGFRVPAAALYRLWSMLAHWHGQTLNSSELARSLGISDVTVRHQIDLLAGAYVLRVLPPWHQNLAKRQVKAPKVYVADSGLLHALLGLATKDELLLHPKVGASWEGFAIAQVLDALGTRPGEAFFWRTYGGAEIDLVVMRGRERRGFEVKLSDAPAVTPSMRIALEELKLDGIDVLHAGNETYPLADGIRALAVSRLAVDLPPLRGP
jgi:predicted AAA+ superfamily ATPase